MSSHDELRNKALATYNAAADRYDDSDNTFWELFGRRTIARLGLSPGMHVLDPRVLSPHNPSLFADRRVRGYCVPRRMSPVSLTILSRRLLVLCAVGAVWILPAAARQKRGARSSLTGS